MKKTVVLITTFWILLVAASCVWNYAKAKDEQLAISLKTARAFFDQVILTRAWNSDHGGVYVPITKDTQPNPFLIDPLREIKVNEKLTLTKINPSFMTRQISEIAESRQGIKFHITSLKPLRPGNRPNPREQAALLAFAQGAPEVTEIMEGDTAASFFYMAPMVTEKDCLECHASQGYKEGEIRGGISVTLPFVQQIPVMSMVSTHVGIGLAGLLGIFVFGTRLNRAHETLQRQAVMDALTGIPNRHSFSERIFLEAQRSARENSPLSVIMGDIDNFKHYNDTYGHQHGDTCLKNVAQSIAHALKRPGDFCARYGGEEFIIILPNTPQAGARIIAEEIRQSIVGMSLPHEGSATGTVTISLGVATKDTGSTLPHEELLKQADQALYLAKGQGRNRVEVAGGGAPSGRWPGRP